MYTYGITVERFNELVSLQNSQCAICGISPKLLNVDHCHSTGKVRGLLCTKCNHAIGQFGDNLAGLEKAYNYLKKAECNGDQ